MVAAIQAMNGGRMSVENRLASLVKGMTGVCIDPEKYYLFEQRFGPLMRDYNLADYAAMADKISEKSDLLFLDRVIEQITTHETRFFRDESFFNAFRLQILPEWLEKTSNPESLLPRRIRIWSAACSTGQEIWSLAILIAEHFPQLIGRLQFYASDISNESIRRAEAGVYSAFEISRGMPSDLLLKYFTITGSNFRINREKLPAVEFFRLNLLQDPIPGDMDLVLCRNVAFYFSEEDRRKLFQAIQARINPYGVLILGSSESVDGYLTDYVLRECGLARYYEIRNPEISIFKRKNAEG